MTEVIKITIGEIVSHLIRSMLDDIDQDEEKLEDLCMKGFKGYANMTDAELIREYRFYISEDPEADIEIQLEG